jgi:hypothetical protein
MNIPDILQAGDTFSWTDSLADYPAPTYTLKYSLYRYGQDPIAITAAASGTDHVVTVTAATTAAYATGTWNWSAYAEAGTARYTVGRGTVTIKPYLAVATSTTDNRSHAQKMLDLIEAALVTSVTANAHVVSITIDGKAVQYKREELLVLRDRYKWEVYNDKKADLIAQGLDPGKRILTRFQ